MIRAFDSIDLKSVSLFTLTVLSNLLSELLKLNIAPVIGWVTLMAGLSTIIYNFIRILFEVIKAYKGIKRRKKQNDQEDGKSN